ncbi:MAG: dihydroorotase, partial [Solirubrobacteraceae bacterium]
MTQRLFHKRARAADLLIRGAHVLDPRAGIDGPHDILIRDGRIAELGAPATLSAESLPPTLRTLEAAGQHAFPAFVDPHVHLRSP